MSNPYDDIINLPHHVSTTRPQMPIANRAAQFTSFAALTGYDDAIKETARLTDTRIELCESDIADLDMKLNLLADRINEHPEVVLTYFQPDGRKEGGAYVTVAGQIKRIDDYERVITLEDGVKIGIGDILKIDFDLVEEDREGEPVSSAENPS